MILLYPQFLWLFIPLGLLVWQLRPKTLRQTVHLIILGLLILTLSRPQLKEGLQAQPMDAKEILIALDVSYSMRAQDIAPDRYTYAKVMLKALLQKNSKDNILLIAFTTNPLLLSPPTTDHQLVRTALDALEPKHILTKGTSLQKLFAKIAALPKVPREVLLVTDGGEERDLQPLLDTLQGLPIHLTIFALGTAAGTTIPTPDGRMLKDDQAHLVISRINPLLHSLADATDGTYLTASGSPLDDAKTLYVHFQNSGQTTRLSHKMHHNDTELYTIPLLLAIMLFLMLHTRASRYLLLFFAMVGLPLHAGLLDGLRLHQAYDAYKAGEHNRTKTILLHIKTPSLQQQYALASTYYRLGDYPKARTLFAAIRTSSPQLKQRLYYNIANTYSMEGMYDKARIYYTKALQLGEDSDAAHNLALVIHRDNASRSQLGTAHPRSQSSQTGESDNSTEAHSQKQRKEQAGSGAGAGGKQGESKPKPQDKKVLLEQDERTAPLPLGSKVYELINEGYIRETQPW